MAKVIVGMTMSLDGYVNDRNGGVGALYPDLNTLRHTELMQRYIRDTGAVVMGRNAYEMAEDPDSYAGNYEFQVPIFVLTHEVPKRLPNETGTLSFTFVTDGIESAIKQAKKVARNKDVQVIGGASTARQCIKARLADELHIDIMPVLLCGGLPLLEDISTNQIRLEKAKVDDLPAGRTHLEFRVMK